MEVSVGVLCSSGPSEVVATYVLDNTFHIVLVPEEAQTQQPQEAKDETTETQQPQVAEDETTETQQPEVAEDETTETQQPEDQTSAIAKPAETLRPISSWPYLKRCLDEIRERVEQVQAMKLECVKYRRAIVDRLMTKRNDFRRLNLQHATDYERFGHTRMAEIADQLDSQIVQSGGSLPGNYEWQSLQDTAQKEKEAEVTAAMEEETERVSKIQRDLAEEQERVELEHRMLMHLLKLESYRNVPEDVTSPPLGHQYICQLMDQRKSSAKAKRGYWSAVLTQHKTRSDHESEYIRKRSHLLQKLGDCKCKELKSLTALSQEYMTLVQKPVTFRCQKMLADMKGRYKSCLAKHTVAMTGVYESMDAARAQLKAWIAVTNHEKEKATDGYKMKQKMLRQGKARLKEICNNL